MNKPQKIMGNVLKSVGFPADLDPHRFFVQWIAGAECLIEQHRGILCFEPGRIRFATEQGTLSVEGEDLNLLRMTEARAVVSGTIREISLEGKS